jgi:hypothetical protein
MRSQTAMIVCKHHMARRRRGVSTRVATPRCHGATVSRHATPLPQVRRPSLACLAPPSPRVPFLRPPRHFRTLHGLFRGAASPRFAAPSLSGAPRAEHDGARDAAEIPMEVALERRSTPLRVRSAPRRCGNDSLWRRRRRRGRVRLRDGVERAVLLPHAALGARGEHLLLSPERGGERERERESEDRDRRQRPRQRLCGQSHGLGFRAYCDCMVNSTMTAWSIRP